MTVYDNPHTKVPFHLVAAQPSAPALSVYFTSSGEIVDDYNIQVDDTGIDLTRGADVVTIPYIGKSIADIQSDVMGSSLPFVANQLNEAATINSGDLSMNTGEQTSDGGLIVRMNRHVIKYKEETRIHLLPPYPDVRDLPWYPRINVGQFSKDHFERRHVFSVPEYKDQIWSRKYGKPYMEVTSEEPAFETERKIRVAKSPILWNGNNIIVRIKDRAAPAGIIEDVDVNNGFIYLNADIADTNGVTVSYVYKEEGLIYKDVNLNPSVDQNPYIIGHFVLFYVIPQSTEPGNISRGRTVFHKISRTLLGAIHSIPQDGYPVTLLGALQVRQTNTIDDLTINDSRIRGGGIKEERWEEAIKSNKNVHSMADKGRMDGVPYPGSSVVIFKLPEELRDTLSVEDIKQRATKHLAMGVTPIIEFE